MRIMLTDAMVANFAALAGESFTWEGTKGGHRPTSKVREPLRADLLARQGGICPVCGTSDPRFGAWEFNHVVAAGNVKRGFFPGNVFSGHSGCNAATKPIHDETGAVISGIAILPVSHFARPDVIPVEWTPFPILKSRS